jgi:hypothetical protein
MRCFLIPLIRALISLTLRRWSVHNHVLSPSFVNSIVLSSEDQFSY